MYTCVFAELEYVYSAELFSRIHFTMEQLKQKLLLRVQLSHRVQVKMPPSHGAQPKDATQPRRLLVAKSKCRPMLAARQKCSSEEDDRQDGQGCQQMIGKTGPSEQKPFEASSSFRESRKPALGSSISRVQASRKLAVGFKAGFICKTVQAPRKPPIGFAEFPSQTVQASRLPAVGKKQRLISKSIQFSQPTVGNKPASGSKAAPISKTAHAYRKLAQVSARFSARFMSKRVRASRKRAICYKGRTPPIGSKEAAMSKTIQASRKRAICYKGRTPPTGSKEAAMSKTIQASRKPAICYKGRTPPIGSKEAAISKTIPASCKPAIDSEESSQQMKKGPPDLKEWFQKKKMQYASARAKPKWKAWHTEQGQALAICDEPEDA